MTVTGWVLFAAVTVIMVAALGLALWQRQIYRYTMKRLMEMLDAAIDGTFREQDFDESLLSAVESKLNGYLSASAVSSRNLAAEKDKIKELIADISHQTKTPLSNLLLYAQLLQEQGLPEESRVCIQALNAQAEKLSFLIATLVKLSRLETGVLTVHPKKNAVQPMLEEVCAQLSPKAVQQGVALVFETTDAEALFDPKWTAEAIFNLVDNAVKYTPAGGAVSVSVTPYDLFCRIDVKDTGMGIPEEELPKVFARFYRSPAVAGREGVGIGLYLARQILSKQGGYIKVASKPGEGSVFSAFLSHAR